MQVFLLIKFGEESMGVRGIVKKQGLGWQHKKTGRENCGEYIQ